MTQELTPAAIAAYIVGMSHGAAIIVLALRYARSLRDEGRSFKIDRKDAE